MKVPVPLRKKSFVVTHSCGPYEFQMRIIYVSFQWDPALHILDNLCPRSLKIYSEPRDIDLNDCSCCVAFPNTSDCF